MIHTGRLTLAWIARIAVVLGLSTAQSLDVQAQTAIDATGLQRADFTVDGVSYEIVLPQGGTARLKNVGIEIWDQHTTRRIRMFSFGPPSGEIDEKYAFSKTISNGAILRYNLDRDVGGGMGGTEGELKGRLEIATHVIAVTCRDQSKGFVEPEWCVPYLHHLILSSNR